MNKELLEIIQNFKGFHPDMLYSEMIVLKKKSKFNEEELIKFLTAYSYIIGEKEINPQQIRHYWELSKKINISQQVEILNNSLNDISPGWIGMKSPQNSDNKNNDEQEEIVKIYLSVDNSSLHLFANLFLIACLEYGYTDFNFKINKDESINRRDNVVIYCNVKKFRQYVNLIHEIIQNNSNIIFNSPHLLGIPYDKHIYCGIDSDDKKTSYTELMCEVIYNGLVSKKSPKEIVILLENFKEKHRHTLVEMANTQVTNNVSIGIRK